MRPINNNAKDRPTLVLATDPSLRGGFEVEVPVLVGVDADGRSDVGFVTDVSAALVDGFRVDGGARHVFLGHWQRSWITTQVSSGRQSPVTHSITCAVQTGPSEQVGSESSGKHSFLSHSQGADTIRQPSFGPHSLKLQLNKIFGQRGGSGQDWTVTAAAIHKITRLRLMVNNILRLFPIS